MLNALLIALVILGMAVNASAEPAISVQEALLRTKPAVAIVVSEIAGEVTLSCGGREIRTTPTPIRQSDSGWFVGPGGWLITNAHVVAAAHQPSLAVETLLAEAAAKAACPSQPRALQPAKVALAPSVFVILSNGIRVNAKVAKYSPPPAAGAMSGQDLALLRLEAADMPTLPLGDSTAARIGDPIHIIGFPGVVMTHELLNASAKVEASVTNGTVSGFKRDVSNQPVIQTDASAAWGNSGGPAVDPRGRVLGVLTFVAPRAGADVSVQGFNFVIPVAAVKEFLAGTEVNIGEPSRFNAEWYAGLRAYFSDDYTAARKHFTEANRLLPELPDVRRIAADTDERIKHPSPRPFPWALVATVVVAASAGAFGLLGFRRWQRNRFRIRPSEVSRLLETAPERPIILDVRDGDTYRRSPVRIPDSLHLPPEDLEQRVSTLAIEPQRTVVAYCT